jgi:UDP-N-acetyl-alpha-D-quinovosamine dehydrogenase
MSKKRVRRQAKKRGLILVTGATSSMGRRLIEGLLEDNYEVRVLLRKHPREHREWRDLPGGIEIYVADIKQTDGPTAKRLSEACKGVDTIFHLAAATYSYGSRYSNERADTNTTINTNVIGTENILQAYADANPGKRLRFVYASTVAVYGYKRGRETLTEESEPHPENAYGESKYMAEQVIKAFAAANKNLSYTIFRIGVIYGRGYEESFMRIFKLIKEGRIRYVGSGENHLTLVNLEDVVSAMLKAMKSAKVANRIYNLTDGVPYTQRQLFKKAAQFLNADEPRRHIHPILAKLGAKTRGISDEQFTFLISDRIVSIERIKRDLGFRPAISIDVAGKALAKEFLKQYNAK